MYNFTGHSWCGFPYDNNVPGFAPDVTTMLNNFGGDYNAAATAYCGLEAEFTTPDGKKALLYIADGFDSKWVRTPGSIDVITGSVSPFPLFLCRRYFSDDFFLLDHSSLCYLDLKLVIRTT